MTSSTSVILFDCCAGSLCAQRPPWCHTCISNHLRPFLISVVRCFVWSVKQRWNDQTAPQMENRLMICKQAHPPAAPTHLESRLKLVPVNHSSAQWNVQLKKCACGFGFALLGLQGSRGRFSKCLTGRMSSGLRGRCDVAPVRASQHQAILPALDPGPRLRRSHSWPPGLRFRAGGLCAHTALAEEWLGCRHKRTAMAVWRLRRWGDSVLSPGPDTLWDQRSQSCPWRQGSSWTGQYRGKIWSWFYFEVDKIIWPALTFKVSKEIKYQALDNITFKFK